MAKTDDTEQDGDLPVLMTKAAYAEYRGCSAAYLSKRDVKDRLDPAMEVDPEDGKLKINRVEADKILKAEADPARAPVDDESEAAGYAATKTARERIRLQREQLDLEERLGNTVAKKDVEDAAAKAGHEIREALKSRNKRLADSLSTMSDVREIRTLLDEEDRKLLETISDDFMRKLSIGDAGADAAA